MRRSGLAPWLAVGAAIMAAIAAHASDSLDAYRALAHGERERVVACARGAIERALLPADTLIATVEARAGRVRRNVPDTLALDWPGAPCGVYLSLARGRVTRACVGSLTPLDATLAGTLRELARRVVSDDPRHPPVRSEELDTLAVLVSFAGTPEPIADPMVVSPAREGLLITSAQGSIAFLPGEARTVSWALGEARRVGILRHASDATFQRFAVVVLKDVPADLPMPAHPLSRTRR